jgi:hypothetical protein
MPLTTPVAFIIFNRADTAALVFAEIRKAQPKKLFVIADGPRTPEEAEKCRATRAVIDGVDWDCEVHRNYSDVNLGCGPRVSSGITWVFENVEEAIILEDDCLPDPSFFPFCEQMLEEYRDDENLMLIGGTNVIPDQNRQESYMLCRLTSIWGWATWRRAWRHYDYEMKAWPEYKETKDLNYYGRQKNNVYQTFDTQYKTSVNTWDTQWWFSCAVRQGLSITPKVNLISNIGFREDATHTAEPNKLSNIPTFSLQFPLVKPKNASSNAKYDEAFLEYCWGPASSASEKAIGFLHTAKSKIKILARMQSIVQAVKGPNSVG